MTKSIFIDPQAKILDRSRLYGDDYMIDAGATMGLDITLGGGVSIGAGTELEGYSYVGDDVSIGPHVLVKRFAMIMDGALICPDAVASGSSDARYIGESCSIGPNVLMHNEVELGVGAIVPTQGTIASLGNFGSKKRVVTVYGSEEGPRYSVGCQIGVSLATFNTRVIHRTSTNSASAETYAPFMSIFQAIGLVVQTAYDKESALIEEMRDIRWNYALDAGYAPDAD